MRKISSRLFALALGLLLLFPTIAYGDMGPKASITITVKNPPEQTYLLDLLVDYDGAYDNMSNKELPNCNVALVQALMAYHQDGWYPGLAHGTTIPMLGNLTGQPQGKDMVHTFSYSVPDRYKVIVVTPEREIKTTRIVESKLFQQRLVLDYNTMEIQDTFHPARALLVQFASTLLPTLAIEGILLAAFGLWNRKNLQVFLITNGITQLLLSVIMAAFLAVSGLLAAYLIFFPLEIIIFAGETIAFCYLMRGKGTGRKITYGLTANLASGILGLLLLSFQWMLCY